MSETWLSSLASLSLSSFSLLVTLKDSAVALFNAGKRQVSVLSPVFLSLYTLSWDDLSCAHNFSFVSGFQKCVFRSLLWVSCLVVSWAFQGYKPRLKPEHRTFLDKSYPSALHFSSVTRRYHVTPLPTLKTNQEQSWHLPDTSNLLTHNVYELHLLSVFWRHPTISTLPDAFSAAITSQFLKSLLPNGPSSL